MDWGDYAIVAFIYVFNVWWFVAGGVALLYPPMREDILGKRDI